MRLILFAFSILFTYQCFGQKWYLNSIDKNKEYPFEYWFQFQHQEDTCSYQMSVKPKVQKSVIHFFDNQGIPVNYANVKLINIENESSIYQVSDHYGKLELQLTKGKYRLEVSAFKYDNFNLEIEIEEGAQIELLIKLGLAPELTVYQIDSKTKLNKKEITEIIKCIRINKNDFYKKCSDLKKYRIMMHI